MSSPNWHRPWVIDGTSWLVLEPSQNFSKTINEIVATIHTDPKKTFFTIKLWTKEFWSFWVRTLHLLNWIFGQNKMFWHSVHSRLIGHAFQVLFKTKKCGLISSFWTSWNFQKFYGKLIIICCLMIMKTLMTLASASIHPSFVCTSCRTCWVVNMGWASSFSWLWCIVLITHVIYRREEKKRGTQSKSCCGSRP